MTFGNKMRFFVVVSAMLMLAAVLTVSYVRTDHEKELAEGWEEYNKGKAEAEAEPWGRVRRSFLLRLRLNLAVASLTLAGGRVVGARRVALFSR